MKQFQRKLSQTRCEICIQKKNKTKTKYTQQAGSNCFVKKSQSMRARETFFCKSMSNEKVGKERTFQHIVT